MLLDDEALQDGLLFFFRVGLCFTKPYTFVNASEIEAYEIEPTGRTFEINLLLKVCLQHIDCNTSTTVPSATHARNCRRKYCAASAPVPGSCCTVLPRPLCLSLAALCCSAMLCFTPAYHQCPLSVPCSLPSVPTTSAPRDSVCSVPTTSAPRDSVCSVQSGKKVDFSMIDSAEYEGVAKYFKKMTAKGGSRDCT